ncbi:MAG: hypothetical protein WAM42_26870 [Candidatus Nitrosopolaris sp.]
MIVVAPATIPLTYPVIREYAMAAFNWPSTQRHYSHMEKINEAQNRYSCCLMKNFRKAEQKSSTASIPSPPERSHIIILPLLISGPYIMTGNFQIDSAEVIPLPSCLH